MTSAECLERLQQMEDAGKVQEFEGKKWAKVLDMRLYCLDLLRTGEDYEHAPMCSRGGVRFIDFDMVKKLAEGE